MKSARRAIAALIFLVAAGLAGCATTPPASTPSAQVMADPPELTVGDRWEYKVTQARGGSTSRITMVVESTDATATLGNVTYLTAAVVNITREDPEATWSLFQLIKQRRDLAHLHIDVVETETDLQGNRTTARGSVVYDQPCRQSPWPLQQGASLSERCNLRVQRASAPRHYVQHIDQVVEAYERVSVPAGTFDAFRLNVTLLTEGTPPLTELKWWAPAACGFVKSTQKQAEGSTVVELVTHRCAKPGAVRPIAPAAW